MVALPRVCIKDGCPEIAGANGRCSDHPPKRSPSSRATSQAGWKAIRTFVLERDARTCYLCGGDASTVDHVTPVSCGGTNDPSNLRAACWRCNRRKG